MKFNELKIDESIQRALCEENYLTPTPIQYRAIPPILEGKDLLGSAQTGTGKTAAFAIPILHRLIKKTDRPRTNRSRIRALVVTPTRELAIQIGESFSVYGKYSGLKNTVIFGGVNQHAQVNTLKRGVDILIATPGRLLDLITQGYIDLGSVQQFVLDEADRMLDMGFIHDIRKIIGQLPRKRQSLFFSATLPENIIALSKTILSHPVKVQVNPASSTAETVRQWVYYTNKPNKKDLLYHILDNPKIDQVLLFSRTKHGADKIVRHLKKRRISSAAIHGDKGQNQRQKALTQFKRGDIRVLVATDIAARGLDIEQLEYVINYDIPNIAETYVHRIGRSGRAGLAGNAISLCEPEENVYVKEIEKLIRLKIESPSENPFPQTDKPMNTEEKKVWEQEKQRKKQEFFAARKKRMQSRSR